MAEASYNADVRRSRSRASTWFPLQSFRVYIRQIRSELEDPRGLGYSRALCHARSVDGGAVMSDSTAIEWSRRSQVGCK
jgi:hypothetical protein